MDKHCCFCGSEYNKGKDISPLLFVTGISLVLGLIRFKQIKHIKKIEKSEKSVQTQSVRPEGTIQTENQWIQDPYILLNESS